MKPGKRFNLQNNPYNCQIRELIGRIALSTSTLQGEDITTALGGHYEAPAASAKARSKHQVSLSLLTDRGEYSSVWTG